MNYKFSSTFVFFVAISIMTVSAQKKVYLDETQPIEKRIENALSLMTTDEKVALCHAQSKFSSAGVARLGIPEIWMTDGPHGVREEILWDSWNHAEWTNDSCTAFPALTCLASTFNPALALRYGIAIGEEARYRKKDILLGPGVNIYRTPLNGRNFEYMGEDPFLASKMVVPYIHGVQQNGVAACVKHYALNNQEKDRFDVDVNVSDRALREIYLPAFKAAVVEGKVWSIMGAYNKLRGQHACHNDLLLNKILKGEWAFDGVVVTDWGGAHNTLEAINNGLDIEMGTGTDGMTKGTKNAYEYYYLAKPYKDALRNGTVAMSTLDDKARRILRLIFRTSMASNRPWGSFVTKEHSETARAVADEGIVLLKNSTNILPLDFNKYKNIAVIGENATRKLTLGGGSSELKVKYEVSPLEGLINCVDKSVKINYSMGYASGVSRYGKTMPSKLNADSLFSDAINLARNADVVLFVGGLNKNFEQDTEGGDRITMNLPYGQDKLIAELQRVNKNIVVVLATGNAVAMPWINDVPAIVQSWYLGSESGNAIAGVLSGKVNPSGKLPFTFPINLADNGAHAYGEISYPGVDKTIEYKDDILVGYRWHDTKKIAPLFSFGHGLSYTTFEYGKATTDKTSYCGNDIVKLTFNVKNTGKVKGAESSQVYVTQNKCSVLRPAKELKGFAKTELDPGESKLVEIHLPVKDWAYYNDKTQKWVVEPGKFNIQVGTSSASILQKLIVVVN